MERGRSLCSSFAASRTVRSNDGVRRMAPLIYSESMLGSSRGEMLIDESDPGGTLSIRTKERCGIQRWGIQMISKDEGGRRHDTRGRVDAFLTGHLANARKSNRA